MRISTSMQYTTHLKYLQKANSSVDEASRRYNTGLRFQNAGEDPSGMAQKVKYTGDIAAFEQYKLNASMVAGNLSEEETALGSIWDTLSSIQTRLQQAINGTMDQNSLDALAEDIEQSRNQIYDLMNFRNAEGEYIFAGSDSTKPAITLNSDGNYYCTANGSARYVQVSPTMTVQTSDSALNIFQHVEKGPTFTQTNGANITTDHSYIKNYDDYQDLYDKYHSTATGANNNLTVTVNDDKTYVVTAPDGTQIAEGEVTDDGTIEFKGIVIEGVELDANTTQSTITIGMDDIEKDNILNTLNEAIDALRDPDLSTEERTEILARAQISVQNSKDNVDMYRGQVGARAANIDNIITSNESLSVVKQTAKAEVTEADAFEAVSDLIIEQNALQVAQQSYGVVHGTSLFDFI